MVHLGCASAETQDSIWLESSHSKQFDFPLSLSRCPNSHSRVSENSSILISLPNPETSVTTLTIPSPIPAPSNAKVIGRNFIFMGLEVVITLVCTLLTTVVIARVIGPTRLGYFNLIFWLTSITCSVGSLGIPLTTFKYMGEFLGGGQKDLARAVFFYNLWAQTAIACALTVIGMIVAFTIVDPAYRLCSVLLVLSMVPNMITFVPSQANSAAEDAALNTRGAFVGAIVYVIAVAVSLLLGWNLVGIAAGVLLYRTAELAVKILPVFKSMKTVPRVPLPADIRKRMFSFSGLSTGLMILADRDLGPVRHRFSEIAAARYSSTGLLLGLLQCGRPAHANAPDLCQCALGDADGRVRPR